MRTSFLAGALIAVERNPAYRERRTDGYQVRIPRELKSSNLVLTPDNSHIPHFGCFVVYLPGQYILSQERVVAFQEPELILLVGTLHVSQSSAEAARRVIEVVTFLSHFCEKIAARRAMVAVTFLSHFCKELALSCTPSQWPSLSSTCWLLVNFLPEISQCSALHKRAAGACTFKLLIGA